MAKEFKYGKMEANTRATGKMIWLMVEADLFIQMETYTKENG